MFRGRTFLVPMSIGLALSALGALVPTAGRCNEVSPELKRTYDDIEKTLGQVPSFLKSFPAEGLPGAWEALKSVQMNPGTALSGKVKELIGLGVAAQIPCRYCIHFHTEAAELNGAPAQEIDEALVMAALTRHWSTVANGSQLDEDTFRKEADGIIRFVKARMEQTASTK